MPLQKDHDNGPFASRDNGLAMASPDPLRAAIRTATADGKVTDQEWHTILQPVVEELPLRATDGSRALLDIWASSRFELDPEARRHLGDSLHSRGYPVMTPRPVGGSDRAFAQLLASGNVGEVDQTFQRLAQRAGRSSGEVNVAVLDNGFDLFHPELGRKGWMNAAEVASNGQDDDGNGLVDDSHGWDFVNWDNDTGNPHGDWHGTHVAGIATQGTDQVNLIPLRVLEAPYDVARVAVAVEYAIDHGAKAINLSFGIDTPERVQVMSELIARHPDVLFVAAAGNDGRSLDSYDPSSFLASKEFPNLAVVAASEPGGGKWEHSNYGPTATHAARGAGVFSTIPGAGYQAMSGTSMAAPGFVAAAAKCLILDPALSPDAVKRLLADTSDHRADWTGAVQAGGPINSGRACTLAALTGLVRRGETPSAAAAKLGLTREERALLLPMVPRFLAR
jgi:subtilisin family serine protease